MTILPEKQCLVPVKAVPGAPRSEVCGMLGEMVKVKVKAPPVEGKANEVLLRFLAETLELPARNVSLARGDTSRQKMVKVIGLDLAGVKAKLGL